MNAHEIAKSVHTKCIDALRQCISVLDARGKKAERDGDTEQMILIGTCAGAITSAADQIEALDLSEFECSHEYHRFGDQPFRRCNRCNAIERTEQAADAKLAEESPQASPGVALDKAVDDFVDGFEIDAGEGVYTPTEHERFVMKEFVLSLLNDPDIFALLAPHPPQALSDEEILSLARTKLDIGLYHGSGQITRSTDAELIAFARAILTQKGQQAAPDVSAWNAALDAAEKLCDEYEQITATEKDSAILVGKVDLSIAMSGEPRAARFIAEKVRALRKGTQ